MEWTDLYDASYAYDADPRDTCDCPTCHSDMAFIAPCMAASNDNVNEDGEERA